MLNLKNLKSKDLHTTKISEHTSIIAKEKKVRNILKSFQRKFSDRFNKVCIEGRDIGKVVFPEADHKFFMWANADISAQRRLVKYLKNGKKERLNLMNP